MDYHPTIGRGTGRTTEQMKNAATGAFYVWCNRDLNYPKRLAQRLGRSDLRVVFPGWLRVGWRGLALYPGDVVLDHAIQPRQLDEEQQRGIVELHIRGVVP